MNLHTLGILLISLSQGSSGNIDPIESGHNFLPAQHELLGDQIMPRYLLSDIPQGLHSDCLDNSHSMPAWLSREITPSKTFKKRGMAQISCRFNPDTPVQVEFLDGSEEIKATTFGLMQELTRGIDLELVRFNGSTQAARDSYEADQKKYKNVNLPLLEIVQQKLANATDPNLKREYKHNLLLLGPEPSIKAKKVFQDYLIRRYSTYFNGTFPEEPDFPSLPEIRVTFDSKKYGKGPRGFSYIGKCGTEKILGPTLYLQKELFQNAYPTFQWLALHESAHALGVLHEFIHPNSTQIFPGEDRPLKKLGFIEGTGYVVATGDYDPDSVMSYFREGAMGFTKFDRPAQLSQGDRDTLKAIYGASSKNDNLPHLALYEETKRADNIYIPHEKELPPTTLLQETRSALQLLIVVQAALNLLKP